MSVVPPSTAGDMMIAWNKQQVDQLLPQLLAQEPPRQQNTILVSTIKYIAFSHLVPLARRSNSLFSSLTFVDWNGENKGCVRGSPPQYMKQNPSGYLFTTLEACCKEHYSWAVDSCKTSTSTSSLSKFFPDWAGANKGCITGQKAPAYMYTNGGTYLFNTLAECCSAHYNWVITECNPAAPNSTVNATVTGNWYPGKQHHAHDYY